MRRVGTESSRKEAIRSYYAAVISANDGLDLGPARTCDHRMRSRKLYQVGGTYNGVLVVLSVLSLQPRLVVAQASVFWTIDFVRVQ